MTVFSSSRRHDERISSITSYFVFPNIFPANGIVINIIVEDATEGREGYKGVLFRIFSFK